MIKNNKKGLTLVELVITIALIGVIAVVFMPIFLLSAKTNNQTEEKLNATYLGKDQMEMIYNLSQTEKFENIKSSMISEDYIVGSSNLEYSKSSSDKLITVVFAENGNLIKVVVSVFETKPNTENKLEVKYETLYTWKGRGFLNE